MEQPSLVPEDAPAAIVAEQEEVAEPSRDENQDQLRLFVFALTFRVLKKCNALKNQRQEDWIPHLKQLVDRTMDGLTRAGGLCPDVRDHKKVCKAVLSQLQKVYGRRLLGSLVILQDPAMDAVIIQTLQVHVREHLAWLARRTVSRPLWKDVFQVATCVAGALVLMFVMTLIP